MTRASVERTALRRFMLTGTATAAVVSLSLATALPAHGGALSVDTALTSPADDAEAYDQEAKDKFAAGDYEGSAVAFEKAFDASGDPAYLFNIGRVYEEAGNIPKAVEFYDRFVNSKNVALEDRKLAVERLEVLRPIADAQKQEEEQAEEPEGAEDPVQPEVDEEPTEPEGPTKKQKTLRIAGFVTLGVGVAALGAGAGLGVVARNRDESIADEPDIGSKREMADRARSAGITADVLYGVGGAAVVTGVVLVVLGYTKKGKGKADTAMVTPILGRDQAGAAFTYRF